MSTPIRPLFGDSLRSAAAPWLERLGMDKQRLQLLIDLATTEKTRLADALAKVFPDAESSKSLQDMTRLRKRLNDAADGDSHLPDLGLCFHVDTKKKSPPEQRLCWFTGPDAVVQRVTQFSEELTADIEGRPLNRSKGITTSTSAMEAGKRVVRFFMSYAHNDKALADKLVAELRSQFGASRRYELDLWIDREILVGHDWRQSIEKAIKDCDFGLFMVSPNFLGSGFIQKNEIPNFIGSTATRPVVPIGLIPIDFDRHDTLGIEERQVFFRQGAKYDSRTFDHMRGTSDKREFGRQLYLEIERRLDAHFGSATVESTPPTDTEPPVPQSGNIPADDLVFIPPPTENFLRTKGNRFNLSDREALDPQKLREAEARDAIDELTTWATDPDGSPFFALLGETGIGKTTTLKQFTRHLLDLRKHNPKVPLPIFIDLRDYVADQPGQVPTIEQLLTSVIERGWRLTHRSVTAQDILRLVRQEGALILFDGLDEKIVHLTQDRGRDFIRTLWSVLPESHLRKEQPSPGQGRLLISCRSHYFRDVWSQNAMLTGQDREGIDRRHYPAFCLLPFTDEQIRQYFTLHLGNEERAAEAMTLIGRVHNLTDLATRPYLLQLISSRLGELEALALEGKPINAATLYDLVTRSWLNRDDGKHQINAAHKRRLMEELAAALWRSGEKQWDADRLEDWLDDFLYANPKLADGYRNKDRDVLKEDLRTATFVLRPDGEAKHFRFAHTSLQEYFLACYLVRTLKDEATVSAAWDTPIVSVETLDFMGQLLALDPQVKKALATMENLLGSTLLKAAFFWFNYWILAIRKGYPEPSPTHVCLPGLQRKHFETWEWKTFEIAGRSSRQPMNLHGANFSGADLSSINARWLDLTGADLHGIKLDHSQLEGICLDHAQLQNANLGDSIGRAIKLTGADLTGAWLNGSNWVVEGLDSAKLPDCEADRARSLEEIDFDDMGMGGVLNMLPNHYKFHLIPKVSQSSMTIPNKESGTTQPDPDTESEQHDSVSYFVQRDHPYNPVSAFAWSPDGRHLVSSSDEISLTLWDAASGHILRTLRGHNKVVCTCAWSADSRYLLSGSRDCSLKLWDSTTGQCLRTLHGHDGSITDCAWSPDSRYFVSASSDFTLKVWDTATGQCQYTLVGHRNCVLKCVWVQESGHVVSLSSDRTLKFWDAATGQCLRTLPVPSKDFSVCGLSPDGRLLHGIHRETVKIWDASTSECLCTFEGHYAEVKGCKWSPNGRYLLSRTSEKLIIWNVASGPPFLPLWSESKLRFFGSYSYNDSVTSCVWSPDGLHLLSGSNGGTLKVWDAQTGECLRTHVHLPNHEWAVIEGHDKRPLALSRGAWPYLAWQVRDTPEGEPYLLPSEAFGPLPEVDSPPPTS